MENLTAIPDNDNNDEVDNAYYLSALEVGNNAAPHTCVMSIQRSVAGPYDFNAIIGSGVRFEDSYWFPPTSDLVQWSDFKRSDVSLSA